MRKIKNILIIANGGSEDAAFIKERAGESDFILAADGGADAALKAGIMPDLVIGDLDSITARAKKKVGALKLFHVTRQDNTDLEKALDFAAYVKPELITIICATGGRLDFTLSNFSSAFKYADKFNILFRGAGWRIYPAEKPAKYKCRKGATVSIIPMGRADGVTLQNLKYPLKNAELNTGMTAVSNIAKKDNFTVKLTRGKLLVMVYE